MLELTLIKKHLVNTIFTISPIVWTANVNNDKLKSMRISCFGYNKKTNWKRRVKPGARGDPEHSKWRNDSRSIEQLASRINRWSTQARSNSTVGQLTDENHVFQLGRIEQKRLSPHSKSIEVHWHTHCHSNNRRAFCTAWRTWCMDVLAAVTYLRSGQELTLIRRATNDDEWRAHAGKSAGRITIKIMVNDFMLLVHGD